MTDRLSTINESLSRKLAARNEFDNTIQETEAAYMKVRPSPGTCSSRPSVALTGVSHACPQILESSQTLLHVLKRESVNLAKKKQTSS